MVGKFSGEGRLHISDIICDFITGILLLIFDSIFIQLAEDLCFIVLSQIPPQYPFTASVVGYFAVRSLLLLISLALTEVSVVDSSLVSFSVPVESAGSYLLALVM